MRWTERCAYILLQVQTRDLKVELRSIFKGWYPCMKQIA